MQEMQVWSLGQEDPLEEEMTTHSYILAWKIPWTEEPGRLQSPRLQSQTWLNDWIPARAHPHTHTHTHTHTHRGMSVPEHTCTQVLSRQFDQVDSYPDTSSFKRFLVLVILLPYLRKLLCLTLCNPMDCSPPGSSAYGISQARLPKWVPISFSRGSSWSKYWTQVSCLAGGFFTTEPPGKP